MATLHSLAICCRLTSMEMGFSNSVRQRAEKDFVVFRIQKETSCCSAWCTMTCAASYSTSNIAVHFLNLLVGMPCAVSVDRVRVKHRLMWRQPRQALFFATATSFKLNFNFNLKSSTWRTLKTSSWLCIALLYIAYAECMHTVQHCIIQCIPEPLKLSLKL